MGGKHCRLYDENLVHNIMISTGLSILEYLKENKYANSEEICEFVEINANSIIEDTIDQLNNSDESPEKKDQMDSDLDEDKDWPFSDTEGDSH